MKADYEFIEEIGRGGQAVTWRARRRDTGAEVAIRALKFAAVREWKTVQLFERESHTLQSLDHPDVPDYVDAFTEESEGELSLYMVQELVEGQSLQTLLGREGRWSADAARRDLAQLLGVLAYLHDRVPPVIHRDIKPSNIIRRPDGRVCLIDFGAVQLDHGTSMASTVIGTPGYMPMEQMIGRAEPRSDLYSLGVTVAHLWTGRDPSQMGLDGTRLDIRSIAEGDPRLLAVLEKLTEPDAAHRFKSARAALAALQAEVRVGTVAEPVAPVDGPEIDPIPGRDRDQIASVTLTDPETSWLGGLLDRPWVVARARETAIGGSNPKVKAAEHLGFRFLGRQTRFSKLGQRTMEVWTSDDGQVYLLHDSARPVSATDGPVSMVSFLSDGRLVTTSQAGSGGLKGRRWELKASGDLVTDHRRHLDHLSDTLGRAPTHRGLDMDAVMALYDPPWFGLEPPEEDAPKPMSVGAKIGLGLLFLALIVPIAITAGMILPFVAMTWLYQSMTAWRGWRDEVSRGLSTAPDHAGWTLPEAAEASAETNTEASAEIHASEVARSRK